MEPRIRFVTACSCFLLAACVHDLPDTAHVPNDVGYSNYIISATIEPGEMAAKTGPDFVIAKVEEPGFPELAVWSNPTMDSVRTNFKISRSLAQVCDVDTIDAFFAEDSAELVPGAQPGLQALADCFTTGPMKGHRLAITGHTDPQGSKKANIELGRARAEAVADYLQSLGLSGRKMQPGSEGEKDAHADPDMWPTDRKVVLDVAAQPVVQQPTAAAE